MTSRAPPTPPRRPSESRAADVLLLVAAALVLVGIGIGFRDPWPSDEPRFTLIAREMLESGSWLIPVRGGELYADKPPLFMWGIAGGWLATGSMRVAFLLPSLAAAIGCVLLVYDIGGRLWSRRVGLLAGLLLLLTIQFTMQGRSAQMDMAVTFWTTLGVYGLLRHFLAGPAPRWFLAAFAAMGIGVITKGVGFLPLLMLLPAVAYLKTHGRGRLARTPPALWLAGVGGFLGGILLWVGPMLLEVAHSGDPALAAYRDEILFGQTVDRYVAGSGGHLRPPWYLVVEVMPWAWLPGTLLLPWAVPAWVSRIRRGDARIWLLTGWVVAVLVFFSLSPGKRGVYILPAAPAFALALAPLLRGLWRRAGPHRAAWALLVLLGLAASAAAAAGFAEISPIMRIETEHGLRPWNVLALLGLAALGAAAYLGPRKGGPALAAWLSLFWIVYGGWGYPFLNDIRTPRTLMADVAARTSEGELAMAQYREQFLLLAHQPVTHFGYDPPPDRELRALAGWMVEAPDRWLLAAREALREHPCFDPVDAVFVGHRHGYDWMLLDRAGVLPCAMPAASLARYRYEPGGR